MFRPSAPYAWVVAVLVFFTVEAAEPLWGGMWETILSIAAMVVYVAVGIYTFWPEKKQEQARPSAVRSRVEAARARQR